MKKNLIIAMVVVAVATAFAYKPVANALNEKPVSKKIAVELYKGNSYASAAYKNTSASVRVIVERVRKNKRVLVWDTTYDAKNLDQFPEMENAKSNIITIPGILDKKEHLEVTYILTYDSKGSQLQMQDATVVNSGEQNGKVAISI